MAQTQTYTGGCHCGAVRYQVEADLDQVIACNCSICSKRGLLLTFAPQDKFTLTTGAKHQADYQFNKKVIHHLFCETCGVESYGLGQMPDGSKVAAINVRCLDGVDLDSLKPKKFDGRSK